MYGALTIDNYGKNISKAFHGLIIVSASTADRSRFAYREAKPAAFDFSGIKTRDLTRAFRSSRNHSPWHANSYIRLARVSSEKRIMHACIGSRADCLPSCGSILLFNPHLGNQFEGRKDSQETGIWKLFRSRKRSVCAIGNIRQKENHSAWGARKKRIAEK